MEWAQVSRRQEQLSRLVGQWLRSGACDRRQAAGTQAADARVVLRTLVSPKLCALLTRASPPRPRGTWRGGPPGTGWRRQQLRGPQRWPTPADQGRWRGRHSGEVAEEQQKAGAQANGTQVKLCWPPAGAAVYAGGSRPAPPCTPCSQLTTKDCPRRQSPAAKMPSMEVANSPYWALKLERGSSSMPGRREGKGRRSQGAGYGEQACSLPWTAQQARTARRQRDTGNNRSTAQRSAAHPAPLPAWLRGPGSPWPAAPCPPQSPATHQGCNGGSLCEQDALEAEGLSSQGSCLAAAASTHWHRGSITSWPQAYRQPPTRSLPGISVNLGGPPFSDGCHSTLTSSRPCACGREGGSRGEREHIERTHFCYSVLQGLGSSPSYMDSIKSKQTHLEIALAIADEALGQHLHQMAGARRKYQRCTLRCRQQRHSRSVPQRVRETGQCAGRPGPSGAPHTCAGPCQTRGWPQRGRSPP